MGKKIYTYQVNYNSKSTRSKRKKPGKNKSGKNKVLQAIKRAFVVFSGLMVITSLFLIYNLQYTKVNSHLIAIRKLEREVEAFKRKNDNLKIEIKRLSQVNRVFDIADKKLGLKPPINSPVVFYVNEEQYNQARRQDSEKHE